MAQLSSLLPESWMNRPPSSSIVINFADRCGVEFGPGSARDCCLLPKFATRLAEAN